MTSCSILYNKSNSAGENKPVTMPSCFTDLNLDQVTAILTGKKLQFDIPFQIMGNESC